MVGTSCARMLLLKDYARSFAASLSTFDGPLSGILVQADHHTEDEESCTVRSTTLPDFPHIPINYFYIITQRSSPNALIPSIPKSPKNSRPPPPSRRKKLCLPFITKIRESGVRCGEAWPGSLLEI
jgi:hypothetical protein